MINLIPRRERGRRLLLLLIGCLKELYIHRLVDGSQFLKQVEEHMRTPLTNVPKSIQPRHQRIRIGRERRHRGRKIGDYLLLHSRLQTPTERARCHNLLSSQQGRQPSKLRENFRKKTMIKPNISNKRFHRTKLNVNKVKEYLKKTEGHKADYNPSTLNKKALAPILNFCSSVAST